MIYGLIFLQHGRISAQEQRKGIVRFAKKQGLKLDGFLSYSELPEFTKINPKDSVIFYAWYCAGKTRPLLKKCINYLIENKIYFYSATSDFYANKRFDFEQLFRAFALYEDIRFSFISDKNMAAVGRRAARGIHAGRHKGTRNKTHVWDELESQILSMYATGHSMYAIGKNLNINSAAVKRCLVAHNAKRIILLDSAK